MAMSIPKSGNARLMKEGDQFFEGIEEAVQRNIEACVALARQTRSAFGPNGMNKIVINYIEKLFVTNDAATILKELDIQHPAARLIVMASQMQEKQIGDGANTVVILAAALLERASRLLDNGFNATEIAAGYEIALKHALELLPKLVIEKAENLTDVSAVSRWLTSAISTKMYGTEEFIALLVAKACVQTRRKNGNAFNVDNIRVCKIFGGGVLSSRMMNGMVFCRGAEGEVKTADAARIAVFACPFDLTQTETKGLVLMTTASELLNFSAGEEQSVEEQIKSLSTKGVTVVVSAGKFGSLYLHFLNKYNIMAVRLTSKFDLRRLCRSIGAQAQARLCTPTTNLLGFCDKVFVEEIGGTEVVVFDKKSERGHVATIIVRGSSQSQMDDVERAIDDAVNTYKALTVDNQLLAGAGAVEIELANYIESISEKCSGLEQYSIANFAEALEEIPKQLAENAGINSFDLLSKLKTVHKNGENSAGVNVDGLKFVHAENDRIFDLYSGKKLALKLATDAANTILCIDQIVMSKRATGETKAKGPKPQDEDDDDGMA